MQSVRKLKAEAREAARFRGHYLRPFRRVGDPEIHSGNRPVYHSACRDCGAWVQVEPNPYPNGVNIGGPAVAIGCNG